MSESDHTKEKVILVEEDWHTDHKRVTPLGRALGAQIARLIQPSIDELITEGEPDERCKTCAFRAGTVPNGCELTLADALKCSMEGSRVFVCHQDSKHQKPCHGWFAWRFMSADRPDFKVPWDYSPDDLEPAT